MFLKKSFMIEGEQGISVECVHEGESLSVYRGNAGNKDLVMIVSGEQVIQTQCFNRDPHNGYVQAVSVLDYVGAKVKTQYAILDDKDDLGVSVVYEKNAGEIEVYADKSSRNITTYWVKDLKVLMVQSVSYPLDYFNVTHYSPDNAVKTSFTISDTVHP